MNLSDLLNETTVCCPLVSNTRNGGIQELLNHAQNLGYISDSIKFYMCLGNHDYGYQNINNSIYQIQYGINSQKENKKWYMPHNYYQFHKK